MAASFTVPSNDAGSSGTSGASGGFNRKRSEPPNQDRSSSHYQRRRKSLKPRKNRKAKMSTASSEMLSQVVLSKRAQQQAQQQVQPPLNPPVGLMESIESALTEADKNKKLLEWELSKLGAEDLRSHAWYHGDRVDRIEAERLLRQCVAEEHGITNAMTTTTISTTANDVVIPPTEGQDDNDDISSDGLEDVSSASSEGDFALDDFLDGLVDNSGNVPDPFTATTTVKAAAILLQQRRGMEVLPTKNSKNPKRNQKHFYCFLVRDSTNVQPPGRYVVSCLRVDKYDNENNDKNKLQNHANNNGDERKRKKFLRRQLQRRQRRQQRRPVLHFVINEIILQPGTVYERSQFTFGDSLPTMATTISSNSTINSSNGRQYQPGFDSVPHLIRYYVGGAEDNAVLSYGGGNDTGINSLFPHLTHTEVRIRYPCNRRCPLTNISSMNETSKLSYVPTVIDHKQIRQHIPASLVESNKIFKSNSIVENFSLLHNVNHQWNASTPTPSTSHRRQLSSSFRSTTRRIPSATVTSATACNPIENTELASRSLSSSSTLPRSLTSSPGPSKITTHSLSSLSTQSMSSTTLPHSFKTPCQPGSKSSSTSGISNTSSRSTTPSSSSTSSSVVPQVSESDLIISTSTGALSLAQRSSITVSINKQPPINKEPSPLRKLRIPDKSLKLYDTSDLFEPSTSSMCGSNASKCEESRIDIDAEIAAALSAVGDDCDTNLDDMFDDPYPVPVQSSFARVNTGNDYQSRFESHQIGSKSHRNKAREHQSRFDTYKAMSENDFILDDPSVIRSNRITGYSLNNNYDSSYQLHRPALLPHPKNLSSLLDSPLLYSPPPVLSLESEMDNKRNHEPLKFQNRNEYSSRHYRPQPIGAAGRELKFENTKGDESFSQEIEESIERRKSSIKADCSKVKQNHGLKTSTLKELADMEIERLVCEGRMDPDQDSDEEQVTQQPTEYEDFDMWRSRWSNSVRNRFDGTPDERRGERLNRRRERFIEARISEVRQRNLFSQNRALAADHMTNKNLSETGLSEGFAAMNNYPGPSDLNIHNRTTTETLASRNSIKSSDIDGVIKNMVNRWIDVPCAKNSSGNIRSATVTRESNNEISIIQQHKSTRWPTSMKSSTQTSGEYQSSLKDNNLSTEKNLDQTQVNQTMVVGQGDTVNVISANKPSTSAAYIPPVNTDTDTIVPEMENRYTKSDIVMCKQVGDYENISPLNDKIQNNENDMNNEQCMDSIENDSIFLDDMKYCSSLESSNHSNCSQDFNAAEGVDYANIVSRVTDNNEEIDYQNVDKDHKKIFNQDKRQKLLCDDNEDSAPVASALRAVHLAIIGDPKDEGKTASVAGTGRLAAALCSADGRSTILPYRHNAESEEEENTMGSCPLQLLGQPGPEGRRARLDVIERFACLQYLVSMTVIVTPCLLLIGNNTKNRTDEHLEWSLEDEYEYRRRKFYYRCAGIGNWYFSGTDSDSDDDDYQLSAGSDFDSGYMLPPKEEWAIEKRHWLDLLNQHRAIALDKWIRTAADTKQAVGDVYGYRALMSALCSDRIQALREAWATLRRLHTATAVTFESRLRPEFLGRRDKHTSKSSVEAAHGFNEDNDNDVDVLLQLPPNATVPDATALAVLYEYVYNDADYGVNFKITNVNDNNSKEDKNPRPSSLFTSPLLLSPSPWSSPNSGISSGLGASVTADYGLQALHTLCIQYSEWVQRNYTKKDVTVSCTKSSPMLQLDRFRNNFQTLLRQYSGSAYDDNNHDDNVDEYVYGYNQYKEKIAFCNNKPSYNRNVSFEYERHYEDKVEEYGACGEDYDDCGDDDDDDDATVICCSNSSSLAINSVHGPTNITSDTTNIPMTEKEPRQTTANVHDREFYRKGDRSECRWIKTSGTYGPAPLNIVFRTELHVRLFWPPTLLIDYNTDSGDYNDNAVNHQLAVPAYALGTTYLALATTAHCNAEKERSLQHSARSTKMLEQVITEQLNQAAYDMRLRYKAMDKFLDGACAYSKLAAKLIYSDLTATGNQQQRGLLPK